MENTQGLNLIVERLGEVFNQFRKAIITEASDIRTGLVNAYHANKRFRARNRVINYKKHQELSTGKSNNWRKLHGMSVRRKVQK